MTNDDKLQEFLILMVAQRRNFLDSVRNYLIRYNPPAEILEELKAMIEDQHIYSENDAFDFIDKWLEYIERRERDIQKISQDALNKRFHEIVRNFNEK